MTTPLRFNKKGAYAKYWIAYLALFSLIQGYPTRDIFTAFLNELISLPPKIAFVYLVMEWLVDKYLSNRKFVPFTLWYIVLIVFFSISQRYIDNYILLEYFLTHWGKDPIFTMPVILYNIIKLQFVVAVPLAFRLFYNWLDEKNMVQQIRSEKMEAELKFLKSQLHPHFLFNVLNNLYSSILQQSPEAPGMVLKLSNLLRYSIYDSNQQEILLEKEIQYIRDYIDLQLTRLNNQVDLSFHLEGDTSDISVIPFVLIPFVENSFKHTSSTENSLPWITIYLEANQNAIILKIENSTTGRKLSDEDHASDLNGKGIGLENVRRRLELLYPQNHQLRINETEESFFVSLKLKPYAVNI